jgi:hypothetical protein
MYVAHERGEREKKELSSEIDSSSEMQIRTFFETYAKDHRFDPLKSEDWYKQTKHQILSAKVLFSHSLSLLSPLRLFLSSYFIYL